MQSAVTPRTLAISEAFGLSLDEDQTYTVFNRFDIQIGSGDIMYITGDSGSGKSLLLRELQSRLPKAISTDDIEIPDDVPIIDGVGQDLEQAMYLLSLVGLNDAFILLRKFHELSEGQKYRFMLAKLLESGADAYLMDEFCALLDRETAKVVSFNMQKICRKLGKTLIVATSHTDLIADLHPSILVKKGLEQDVRVEYRSVPNAPACSLISNMQIEPGSLADYHVLSRFHYRQKTVRAVQHIFKLVNGDEVVGVIVYVYPALSLAGRNAYTPRYKAASSEIARRLNDEVTTISRVVIHPKYRGVGLGAKLIRDTMPMTGKRYVEALTVMGRFNPFNEKAGLIPVPYQPKDRFKGVRNQLILLGWDMQRASSWRYNQEKLAGLDERTYQMVAAEIFRRVQQGRVGCVRGGAKKQTVKTAKDFTLQDIAEMIKEAVPREKVYLIWENPDWRAEEAA
ncbi:ABC transporter ATP-binding protein [Heliobacterium undosum]|uniref:ABC transporter ATP-binding protein n=1 Tax=Heliomicrobium undosum TaxID=121734 RepID=A0A845KY55_9FIRM|nr:ABC transporter ATP-binding protein [Heliomicrobium undosum]MZP28702.1 ABC transporter ATP-binding protein [Heliomicrobium undosum]